VSRRIQVAAPPPSPAGEAVDPLAEGSTVTFTETEGDLGPLSRPLTLGVASRSVTYATTAAATPGDDYLDRLLKYIPAEIIALYLGASNVVPAGDHSYSLALWIITGLTAVCTPVYMFFSTREAGKPTLWSQIIISSVAFPIWVFAIGGPFHSFKWYDQKRWVAAIVISFATFMVGMYIPKVTPAKPEAAKRSEPTG
jgi:uncharacterized membrane protein YoaK (UPF0700 family)